MLTSGHNFDLCMVPQLADLADTVHGDYVEDDVDCHGESDGKHDGQPHDQGGLQVAGVAVVADGLTT